MIKKILVIVALAGSLIAASAHATTTLTLSTGYPEWHPFYQGIIKPWIEAVTKESGGSLVFREAIRPDRPQDQFDYALQEGGADITLGIHSLMPGRFQLTKAAEMAFLGDSAEKISVAYWRIHQRHLTDINEHIGVQLLGLMTHGPGNIFTTQRAINSLDDLDGLMVQTWRSAMEETALAVYAIPVDSNPSNSRKQLSAGVFDGVFAPSSSIKTFNLDGVIRHAAMVPGGMFNTSYFLVANQARFNSLSLDDREALMRASGENFARIAGRYWDAADQAARDTMKEAGVSIITISDAFQAALKNTTDRIEAEWVSNIADFGIDGEVVMKDLRAEIAAQ